MPLCAPLALAQNSLMRYATSVSLRFLFTLASLACIPPQVITSLSQYALQLESLFIKTRKREILLFNEISLEEF